MSGSRRDNLAGTIYQRSNGTWVGRVVVSHSALGRPKYKYISGKSEVDVKKKIRAFYKSASLAGSPKISLETYIRAWMKDFKFGALKPSSYDRLEKTIENQIIPYIGSIQLQSLTASDIQSLLTKLKVTGKSYSTVKKTYDCLNAVLLHATINEDVVKNPMLLVTPPKQSTFAPKQIRYFTDKEAAAITEESKREYSTGRLVYPYGFAYILMLNTGIRMGELIGLEKEDFNRERRTLHIQRNVQAIKARNEDGSIRGGRELSVSSTKTYSGDRTIPLNDNAVNALERILLNNASPYIVCTANGGRVPPERLERTFYRVLRNAGISKTGTHSLRHTFASMLFEDGVDIKTVSSLLGHASIQITLNTYIHLIEGINKGATSSLDSRF